MSNEKNQQGKNSRSSSKKSGKQDEKMSMSGPDSHQSDGRKGHANNPEGHNQYTNKSK